MTAVWVGGGASEAGLSCFTGRTLLRDSGHRRGVHCDTVPTSEVAGPTAPVHRSARSRQEAHSTRLKRTVALGRRSQGT